MRRKHLITTCRPTFTVILKKCDVFWRLLAVCVEKACCYRRFTTRMQLFPRIFTKLPFDYRAKNGIYSYIHRCFTPLAIWTSMNMFIIHILCFGEGKKNCHTVSLIGSTRVCFCQKTVLISSSLSVLHCETYGVHRFGKQVLTI